MERQMEAHPGLSSCARCLLLGAIFAGTAVGLGAYHAHGLEGFLQSQNLSPEVLARRLGNFEVGVRYQFYHALAFMAFAGLAAPFWSRPFKLSISMLAIGTIVFSGSLYLLVFLNVPVLGAVTPLGGVMQIAGWIVVAISSLRVLNGK
jgi:uncharacterized membrane protein YgdD (TMEM256/DUF423 family)